MIASWLIRSIWYVASFMNVYIFSSPINTFKSFLKSSHSIKSFLSSIIFLSHKSTIFNLFDLAHFQDMPENKKATWRFEHNANNRFFYVLQKKKILMLWTTETAIFIRLIARVFKQRKQPYLWFIANNDRNMLWGHNTDNYFLNLS